MIATSTIAAIALAQYLAGYLFLWSQDLRVTRATPLTTLRYLHYFGGVADVRRALLVATLMAYGTLLGALILVWMPRPRSLYGDARFARYREIAAAGLLADRGIILGCVQGVAGRYLVLGGQQGVALAAPPRAGKGTGVVIPNALTWGGSLVCVDIKRENWRATAGYRRACGQPCFLFDPFASDGRTARWNPFEYVSGDARVRVNDLQRIADMLYPDPVNVDPFWTASARSLFLGIALYLFETPSRVRTIGEVLRQGMASDDEGFGQHWKRIVEGRQRGSLPLSPECVRALYDVIDLAPVTASSIRKTFTSRLDLWLNPILDAATSGNDFDLRQLRRRAMSIYVAVNPDDLHRLRPVVNLFFQQAIGLQTRDLPEHDASLRHQVLMLLDEFAALGRIPVLAEAISYLPGYNVRVLLVVQTVSQLREVYGQHNAETMLKSLGARIVFAPKDHADAQEISDELGFTTVKSRAISKGRFRLGDDDKRGPSVTISDQRRALLLPQEVKELGAEDAIVFCEGVRPIRCRKIRYYADARFAARAGRPVPVVPCVPIARTASADSLIVENAVAADMADGASPRRKASRRSNRREQETELGSATSGPEAGGQLVLAVEREPEQLSFEDLTLSDVSVDEESVQLPPGRAPTDSEIELAAERFLASLVRE